MWCTMTPLTKRYQQHRKNVPYCGRTPIPLLHQSFKKVLFSLLIFRNWRGVWDLRRPGRAAWVLAYFLILHDTFGPDMTLSNMKFWPATCNILMRPVFHAGFTYYTQFSKIGFTHCYDTLITNNHAVLSTLPDNPGDSRKSLSLQIRVSRFLLENRQLAKLLFFLHSTFWLWNFKYFGLFELLRERSPLNSGTPL